MEPTLTALAAVAGALITGAIALLTHILSSKRDHKRWVLDLKYKIYVALLRDIEKLERDQGDCFRTPISKLKWESVPELSLQELFVVANEPVAHKAAHWGVASSNLSKEISSGYASMTPLFKDNPELGLQPLPTTEGVEAALAALSKASFDLTQAVRKELGLKEPVWDRFLRRLRRLWA